MKHLKQLSLYTLLLGFAISLLSFSSDKKTLIINPLKGNTYHTLGIAFEKKGNKAYTLTLKEDKAFSYGNFIKFSDSTFSCYYSAPCGNDCFTDVKGEYKFISKDVIQIKVISINKHGHCSTLKNYDKGDFGKYKLILENNSFKIEKI